MTECSACGGRATLFLCSPCREGLEEKLAEMGIQTIATNILTGEWRFAPPMLEQLDIEALGQSKKGESVRRSTDQTSPMPFHERACDLRDEAHDILMKWLTAINRNETLGQA